MKKQILGITKYFAANHNDKICSFRNNQIDKESSRKSDKADDSYWELTKFLSKNRDTEFKDIDI